MKEVHQNRNNPEQTHFHYHNFPIGIDAYLTSISM